MFHILEIKIYSAGTFYGVVCFLLKFTIYNNNR